MQLRHMLRDKERQGCRGCRGCPVSTRPLVLENNLQVPNALGPKVALGCLGWLRVSWALASSCSYVLCEKVCSAAASLKGSGEGVTWLQDALR